MKKRFTLKMNYLTLSAMISSLALSPAALVAVAKKPAAVMKEESVPGYTINFDNVSIKEFLKFISKIAGVNVIYNENELDFNVTIVSEEGTSLENLLSGLVQILRIHNLSLIEEGQNLLIHTNTDVKQIATVISPEKPWKGKTTPAIITKVIRIKRANPSRIAELITPMLSATALVEVSSETREVIITDVPSSITMVEQLLLSLDSSESPYQIASYTSKNISVIDLAVLATQLLNPLADEAPLHLIPQPNTGTLYIVSTPFLIERTQLILQELDKEPLALSQEKPFTAQNVLLYKLLFKSSQEVQQNLQQIADAAGTQGFNSSSLIAVIKNMKYIQATNALMFVGAPIDLQIIQSFLLSVDAAEANASQAIRGQALSFYLFQPTVIPSDQVITVLRDVADRLQKAGTPAPDVIKSLTTPERIEPIGALLFTGTQSALEEVKSLLASVEASYKKDARRGGGLSNNFIIYSPQQVTPEALKQSVLETVKNLKAANLSDPYLLKTLESVKLLPASGQLIFIGDNDTLDRLKLVLQDLDRSGLSSAQFNTYPVTLHNNDFAVVQNALNKLTETLPANDPINGVVRTMRWVPESHMLILQGPQDAVAKVKEIITLTDTARPHSQVGDTFAIVHLTQISGQTVLTNLQNTAKQLRASGTASESLIKSIESVQWTSANNTLLVTGTPSDVARVQTLISSYDTVSKSPDQSGIYVYRLRYLNPDELRTALRGIAEHAKAQDPSTPLIALNQAIDGMRIIPDTNTVQFVGSPEIIGQIKVLIESLDSSDHAKSLIQQTPAGSNFLVYKVKHLTPDDLMNHLRMVATTASKDSPQSNKGLMQSVNSMRYIKSSDSIVFTGDRRDLDTIQTLINNLDVTTAPKQSTPDRAVEGYQTYKPEFVAGPELIQMTRNFEEHLIAAGVVNHNLSEVTDHLAFVNRTNTIILTGNDSGVTQVLALLKQFDTHDNAQTKGSSKNSDIETIDNTGFLFYKMQYQSGDSIVSALQLISHDLTMQQPKTANKDGSIPTVDSSGRPTIPALISAINSVQWISATNSLIGTGDPRVLGRLKELIESIDRPLKQVFIEILVLDVTDDSNLDFGLRWGSQGVVKDRFSWGSGNYPPTDAGAAFPANFNKITGSRTPLGSDIPPLGEGFLGVIGDLIFHKGQTYATLGSLLTALKSDGNTTLVLSQKIVAQDNQNAKIFSGDNIPFTGSLVTTSGLSQTTNANLEYRNVGVTLSITPIIGSDGVITLDIDEEISEEINQGTDSSSNVTTNSVNGIRTSKTSMQTRVHVPDRHFLILSGTMRNQVVRLVSGIPCLGGLPLIGAAFSETSKITSTHNIIIFVKPHIIDSSDTYCNITQRQEILFGSGSQSNIEDFQKGLELVKTADDENCTEE